MAAEKHPLPPPDYLVNEATARGEEGRASPMALQLCVSVLVCPHVSLPVSAAVCVCSRAGLGPTLRWSLAGGQPNSLRQPGTGPPADPPTPDDATAAQVSRALGIVTGMNGRISWIAATRRTVT